ncbi:MAG: invasion associated locus B family protein [Pseudomonadota bacterium]|nr:invasion associated locus B family protein [Pseudomonadota bacterium]
MSRKRGLFHHLALMAAVLAGLSLLPLQVAQAQTSQTAPTKKAQNNKAAFGPRAPKGSGKKGTGAETVATFDDWKVQCETPRAARKDPASAGSEAPTGKSDNEAAAPEAEPAAAASAKRVCGMTQTTRSEKVPQIGLSLFIARARQGDKTQTQMRLLAPIGVYLPMGVALEIDGIAIKRVPFSRCLPQFCVALAEASPETLEKLIKGEAANFILYQGPGAGLPMTISLKGFGKALEALDSL